ncbi:hypothetical protein QE152_g40068 [Popillia japonica]|uniref:Tc1-like transposase DDE domain-containing protein n=1 Tax=Popillia japonica TaxID=7064 RepID=A0AAW1HS56_POPJA
MVVLGDDTIFMQENARLHTARMVTEYLGEVQITQFAWAARSRDINPTEDVWDETGKRLRTHVPASRNFGELRNILVQEWDNLP